MGPITRNSARRSSKQVMEVSDSRSDPSSSEDERDIEDNLARAQEGVQKLRKQLRSVRRANEKLTAELESLRNLKDASEPGSRKAASQRQVKKLEGEVQKLEKARKKDKEKIKKYRSMELKQEAADLEDPGKLGADDTAHCMRKLLRQFHDLMSINVVDEDSKEECPICLDTLKLSKCSSLPCQHLVCNDCLLQICKIDWETRSDSSEGEQGQEITECPQCRKKTPRNETELVRYTPNQQWDGLLDVAKEWAKIDRRPDDTSEEDDEEAFLEDGSADSSSSVASEASNSSKENISESNMAVDRQSTPPLQSQANGARRYLNSPAAAKRKRMEELAERLRKKKHL